MGSLQGRPPARHQVWTHFQARARMLHCTGRQAVRLTPLREYAAACHLFGEGTLSTSTCVLCR